MMTVLMEAEDFLTEWTAYEKSEEADCGRPEETEEVEKLRE